MYQSNNAQYIVHIKIKPVFCMLQSFRLFLCKVDVLAAEDFQCFTRRIGMFKSMMQKGSGLETSPEASLLNVSRRTHEQPQIPAVGCSWICRLEVVSILSAKYVQFLILWKT